VPDREELIQALAQLDLATLEEVVTNAYQRRGNIPTDEEPRPDDGATRGQVARWLAIRHLATDAALERVIYLPANAPDNEIRLLEVNRLLNPPDDAIEPLEFTPVWDLPYRVFVADITSDQWDRLRQNPGVLPPGWDLRDSQVILRG
jgi:hypothetical protein